VLAAGGVFQPARRRSRSSITRRRAARTLGNGAPEPQWWR
jgi:hypothetical protein